MSDEVIKTTAILDADGYIEPLIRMTAEGEKAYKTDQKIISGKMKLSQILDEEGQATGELEASIRSLNLTRAKGIDLQLQFAKNGALEGIQYKNTTRLIEEKRAALLALQAQQQKTNAEANRVVKSVAMGVGNQAAFKKVGAAPLEVQSYQAAIANLKGLLVQHEITAARGKQMWRELQTGAITYASVAEARVGTAMRKVQAAQAGLGASAKATMAQAAAAVNGVAVATEDAAKSSQNFLITWQSFARLLTIQLLHQAISQLSQAIKKGTEDAMEYQLRIAEIQTISQNSAISTADWAKGLEKVSNSFGFDLLDTAEGAYQALSNQVVKGTETFKFMATAQKLAATTVATTAQSVEALSSVINAYGMSAADAEAISAKLFVAINLGRFRMQDLSGSLGQITVMGKQMGASFDELMAGMIGLTRQGMTWANAMTQMRGIMNQLLKPSDALKTAYKELGVASGEEAVRTYTLFGLLDKLAEKARGSSTALAAEFRNMRGLLGVLATTGQAHGAVTEALTRLTNATEEYGTAVEITMATDARVIKKELANIRNYFVNELGTNVLKTIAEISVKFGGLKNIFQTTWIGIREVTIIGAAVILAQIQKISLSIDALVLRFQSLRAITRTTFAFSAAVEAASVMADAVMNNWAKREQEIFDNFTKNIADAQAKMATATNIQKSIAEGFISQAVSGAAAIVANKIAELNVVVKTITDGSVEASKLIGESIGAVTRELRNELSETNSQIKSTEALLKGLQKDSADFDKRIAQDNRRDAVAAAQGKPEVQEQILTDEIANAIQEIQGSAGISDPEERRAEIKRLQDTAEDSINELSELSRQYGKSNTRNLESQETLEKRIQKENLSYSHQIENLDTKIDRNRSKRFSDFSDKQRQSNQTQFESLQTSKQQLTEAHNLAIKTLEEQIAKKKQYNVEEYDTLKMRQQLKKIADAERADITTKQTQTLSGLTNNQLSLDSKIKVLNDLLLGINKFDFTKLIKMTDPTTAIKALKDRAELIKQALVVMNENTIGLTDIEKDKIKAVQERLQDELAATAAQLELPEATAAKAVIEAQAARLAEALKNFSDQITALTDKIATGKGKLRTGLDEAIRVHGSAPIGEQLRAVRNNLDTHPEMFNALPDYWKEMVTAFGEMTPKAMEEFNKDIATLKDIREKQEFIRQKVEAMAEKLVSVTPPVEQAAQSLTKSFSDLVLTVGTFSKSLDTLVLKIDQIKVPTINAEIKTDEPLPVEENALGGYTRHGRDSVRAMLSPGEFVMNATSARRFHSQLVAMNSVGRFANGGPVGNSVNVGDVNISMQSSGNESVDVIKIGRLLQREVRRGTVCLS